MKKTYIIEEDNWRNRTKGKKQYKPKILGRKIPKEQGRVIFEIRNLSRKINERKLKETLSDYYRMLLAENKIKIEINKEPIKPLEIPLIKKERFIDEVDSKEFQGWIGLLKPNVNFRGGIRYVVFWEEKSQKMNILVTRIIHGKPPLTD